MKLTIEQAALHKALARVTAVVESRNTIPILANVLIEAGEDGVWLAATDLNMEARARVDAEIEQPGRITVPATTISDIVRNAPDGAQIAMQINEHRLQVSFGRSRYQVPTLPAMDFPAKKEVAGGEVLEVAAADLRTMIAEVAVAMSTEETRHYLIGAFLHVVSDQGAPVLRMVATDGHRLMMTSRAGLNPPAFPGVIVPRKTVGEIAKAVDGRVGPVEIRVSPAAIQLEVENLVIRSQVIDGTYPDYVRVVPSTWEHEIEIDRQLLLSATRRVTIVSNEKVRALKMIFDNDQLTLQVRNMQAGEGVEVLDIAYQGPPMEIGVNGRYLADALQQTDAETVVFRVHDHASPVRLEPAASDPDHGQAVAVIMPLRV